MICVDACGIAAPNRYESAPWRTQPTARRAAVLDRDVGASSRLGAAAEPGVGEAESALLFFCVVVVCMPAARGAASAGLNRPVVVAARDDRACNPIH